MQLPRDILIVEDELEMLTCLRGYFTDRGHRVVTTATVGEALEYLQVASPDMAFIDLHLPDGSGRAIIQTITKRHLPTRMIVMTGLSDLELREELLAYGVTDYLFKPMRLQEVGRLLTTPAAVSPPTSPDQPS